MPDERQQVVPYLGYEDAPGAIEWLARAFGFTESHRIDGTNEGTISHAEMDTGGGTIMLATGPEGYEAPRRHRERCTDTARWMAAPWILDGVLVYVDDVDEHHARAVSASARILTEPEPGPPGRRYRVEDVEGHRWMFMERG